tara:strand:- start:11 stop:178 length:168 start_codon:yes stop_codon:yes gene_type:complete
VPVKNKEIPTSEIESSQSFIKSLNIIGTPAIYKDNYKLPSYYSLNGITTLDRTLS